MTNNEFKNLKNGDRLNWNAGEDATQPPCDGTVERHDRDDMVDVLEIHWDDDAPSLLLPLIHLPDQLIQCLRKI